MENVFHVSTGLHHMFARKLDLRFQSVKVGSTPMLIPSISSRVNIPIEKILETIPSYFTGPLLISSYDLFYMKKDFPTISFPELIFLDSGGYEAGKEKEIADIGLYKPNAKEWSRDLHKNAIDGWSNDIPTVLISYDHPKERKPISDQAQQAKELFQNNHQFLKEFLIKPRSQDSNFIDLKELKENRALFNNFDIIGFTEKELGNSIIKRMIAIAKIRLMMEESGIEKPIHIFGSLDTITTPLYYFSGADIFDGLSWLRFIFDHGKTMYVDSFGPKKIGIEFSRDDMWTISMFQNYLYLNQLTHDLEKFQATGSFDIFKENKAFFRKTCKKLHEKVGGVI